MSDAKLKSEVLYEDLLKKLAGLAPGKRFPSVRAIMGEYGVGQLTVSMAVSRLSDEGYLYQMPGKGVFTTGQVEKLRQAEIPSLMVAIPRWVSADITEMEQVLETLRPVYPHHRLLIHRFDPATTLPAQLPLTEENVAGLVILPSSSQAVLADVKQLLEYPVPLVVWGWHLDAFGVPSVATDDQFAGSMAAAYLEKRGHSKIGVLLSEPHNHIIMSRVKGIVDYAELNNMKIRIIDCEVKNGEAATPKAYHTFCREIENGLDITALIGISGDSLQGAINACNRLDVKIPDQLGVISIGGEKITETYFPPITAEDIRCREQIKIALDMVCCKDPSARQSCIFRPTIIERRSVMELNAVNDRKGSKK